MASGDEASAFHSARPCLYLWSQQGRALQEPCPYQPWPCLLLGFAHAPFTSLAWLPTPKSLIAFTEILLLQKAQKTKFLRTCGSFLVSTPFSLLLPPADLKGEYKWRRRGVGVGPREKKSRPSLPRGAVVLPATHPSDHSFQACLQWYLSVLSLLFPAGAVHQLCPPEGPLCSGPPWPQGHPATQPRVSASSLLLSLQPVPRQLLQASIQVAVAHPLFPEFHGHSSPLSEPLSCHRAKAERAWLLCPVYQGEDFNKRNSKIGTCCSLTNLSPRGMLYFLRCDSAAGQDRAL